MSTVNTYNHQTILVLGATGKTGSRVVERLAERNWPVRIGSRSADPSFEWNDEATWKPATQNIHTVYLTFHPDVCVPGAIETVRSFVKTAVGNGVQKIVFLSGRGEPEAEACEKIVIESGVNWSIVRASWFCQNFSEGYLLEPIQAGHVAFPASDMPEPFVDCDDIADVAVAALTDDKHNQQIYEVTGPRALSFKQAVEEISKITGKPIRYQKISMPAYTDLMTEYQVPEVYIQLVTYLLSEILDGRNKNVCDGVERALGRKPTDFAEFVKKSAAAGAWN